VIARLREGGSRVSKATVYNTLHLFSSRGLLREIAVDPARLLYDSTTGPHHHFYNEDTGELVDVEPGALEVSRMPDLPAGTDAHSLEVVIRIRNRSR
jgi:Fur family iron response transcriptional regulator